MRSPAQRLELVAADCLDRDGHVLGVLSTAVGRDNDFLKAAETAVARVSGFDPIAVRMHATALMRAIAEAIAP